MTQFFRQQNFKDEIARHDSGVHTYDGVQSVWVSAGQRLYVGARGYSFMPTPLYEGGYANIRGYTWMIRPEDELLFKVESTDVRLADLCELGWANGQRRIRLPASGESWENWKDYPNDALDYIKPNGSQQVTLYADGNKGGVSITLDNEANLFNLGWGGKVSSLVIADDDWTAGVPILDWSRANVEHGDRGETVIKVENDSPFHATHTVTLTQTINTSHETAWSVNTSVTAKAEATASVGVAEVTAGLEVTAGAEYGQTSADGKSTELAHQLEVQVDPHSTAKVTMSALFGKATIPCRLPVTNNRTGRKIYRDGQVIANMASDVKERITGGTIMRRVA